MSMHEIEGLVEDTVRLVAKSNFSAAEKRDFLYNLYRFQNRFDTGYTHFRLITILLELNFTYRIPLEEHPDYKEHSAYFQNLDIKKTYWLPSRIGEEHGSVYAKEEKGAIFLYVDAGSDFWQRLCETNVLPKSETVAPKTFQVSYLILKMMQESKHQEEKRLLQDWYALLINLLMYDFGDGEGFPRTFLKFIAQEEVNKIRDIGQSSNVFSNPDENNDWAQLKTPKLKEIEADENNIERLFCIKWLLDFKSSKKEIQVAYDQAVKPDPLREKKLELVPKAVTFHLGTKNWKLVWHGAYGYGQKWLYYHQIKGVEGALLDSDIHAYLLLDANTEDLKMLYPKIGVQLGKLIRWQGRVVVHKPEHIHFLETLVSVMSKKELTSNKSLHEFGGWKFNLKHSEKTIEKHVDNFFECFEKYGAKVLEEFEKPLFDNFKMPLKEALAYRKKMQYTHRFFLNEIEVYLVYGIHELEQKNIERAHKLARKAMEKAQEKKHPIKKAWIATARSILDGRPMLNELLSFEKSYV